MWTCLFIGLRFIAMYILNWLQSVLNAPARLIYGRWKYDHITPLLQDDLHWMSVPECIKFLVAVLIFRCCNNTVPATTQCQRTWQETCTGLDTTTVDRVCDRQPPTSRSLMPYTWLRTVGDRAFGVAAARVEQSATCHPFAASLDTFKRHLKIRFFQSSYSRWHSVFSS